ncbi:MAG: hypothetical protein ACXAC8_15640 [Candidatus Hodarchaeales archaeon]
MDSRSIENESFIVYSTGLLLTILAGIYFHVTGYPLVVTATEILPIISPPIYMIPIFLLLGILLGELLWICRRTKNRKNCILRSIETLIIALFSLIRITFGIPLSGHMIILFYYLPHQYTTNKCKYPLRILIGVLVLLITIFYKIIYWNDPITFILGGIVGFIVWLPGFAYRSKKYQKGQIQES